MHSTVVAVLSGLLVVRISAVDDVTDSAVGTRGDATLMRRDANANARPIVNLLRTEPSDSPADEELPGLPPVPRAIARQEAASASKDISGQTSEDGTRQLERQLRDARLDTQRADSPVGEKDDGIASSRFTAERTVDVDALEGSVPREPPMMLIDNGVPASSSSHGHRKEVDAQMAQRFRKAVDAVDVPKAMQSTVQVFSKESQPVRRKGEPIVVDKKSRPLRVSCEGQPMQLRESGGWEGIANVSSYERCAFATDPGDLQCADVEKGRAKNLVVLTEPLKKHANAGSKYFHFVANELSKIVPLMENHEHLLQDPDAVFHTSMGGKRMREWLKLLGITGHVDNRVADGWWNAEKLYVPPSNGCGKQWVGPSPRAVQGLRSLIFKQLSVANRAQQPASLAANSKATLQRGLTVLAIYKDPAEPFKVRNFGKAVDNLIELEMSGAELVKFGYVNETCCSYTVKTACEMFHRADLIVGPFDGALANLVCARPGTAVIEIQPEPHDPQVQLLASRLLLPYFGIPIDWGDDSNDKHRLEGDVDIRAILEMAGGAQRRRDFLFAGVKPES